MKTMIVDRVMTNGAEKIRETVILNPHLLRKMEQAQRNMRRQIFGRRRRKRGRTLYWCNQFRKWCDLLIERAQVIEPTEPTTNESTNQNPQ